jgi:hypothetical protein
MQRCVYGKEREASLKPIETLTDVQLLGQHMARLLLSGRKNKSVQTLHIENLKLEDNLQENNFSKG